ncbi:hypothetical protein BJ322DRAFT_1005172 [Thelephora terrestris]|uniref:Uncharacterized protein n=1 Tax=Thelephora terrestris TaxID=56493 RepID=A0A9P6HHR4_9AGAM|nr:hypothetical protein BJ322DRAFT_1005172 [Thelephora terrestris]
MIDHQLSPGLRSLYRLVLRASSASVLHARPATPRLRVTWRPTFEMAAQMAQKVQHPSPTEGGTRAAAQAQEWLNEWENRMDNTLSLLYSSAISRGLPHKLTRNLHTLSKCRKDWVNLTYDRPAAPWRPTGEPVRINLKNAQKSKGESGELAWNMVGEVVRMAEGRDQLMLGRAPPRRRKTYRNLD